SRSRCSFFHIPSLHHNGGEFSNGLLGRLHPQNEEAYQTESYDTKPKHSRVVLSRIYRVSNREVSTVDGMRADGGK
ncbi:hypothetical protein Q3P06_00005, partial [Ralstonia pseudosolanacearum]|uniref:hypothetical protein n=1 Tax=Ralstonia pseudosolanacearum TaxID=1310165 RepID=UPI002674B8D9